MRAVGRHHRLLSASNTPQIRYTTHDLLVGVPGGFRVERTYLTATLVEWVAKSLWKSWTRATREIPKLLFPVLKK